MNDQTSILIVEDSPTQALRLQYILEAHNYRVISAKNGKDALEQMAENRPSIVISDIIMPEMDGYELCKRIKDSETLRRTFVILLTSLSEPKDVLKGLQCGANKFLTKPYDEEHLLSVIHYLLSNPYPIEGTEAAEPIEITYSGDKYIVTSDRLQILSLLISTYETAVKKNSQFLQAQQELKSLNKSLEEKVNKRTEELRTEIIERKQAQGALQEKNEELKAMMQQLWQASKLATMGELAASIAHELNNPLATVNLRVESLLAQIQEGDQKRRSLEVIEQEVERMANLVSNLLEFSRRSQKQVSTIDVCREVANTLELVHYHLRKHRITVAEEFEPGLPAILADRQQLRQVFLNIFTNAGDAMPEGGILTIHIFSLKDGIMDRARGRMTAALRVQISDTGTGMPPETLARALEPFFTTKPEGKGTGLGLPICKRIVQEHGGDFRIESIQDQGTTVSIDFPIPENGRTCNNIYKGE